MTKSLAIEDLYYFPGFVVDVDTNLPPRTTSCVKRYKSNLQVDLGIFSSWVDMTRYLPSHSKLLLLGLSIHDNRWLLEDNVTGQRKGR